MSESAEAERHLGQTVTAAMSVALNIAMQAMQKMAERARQTAFENEQRQHEVARQLAAERETAAVMWRRADDPEWVKNNPVEVAQTWASAVAWEDLDPRAAEARAKFDTILSAAYGAQHPAAAIARETRDFNALAMLLTRATEPSAGAETTYYEEVPQNERRQWLESQIWGADVNEETRIAASAKLADLDQGLPVSVLREMSPAARQAWIEYDAMDIAERRLWRNTWLARRAWGRDSEPEERRAAAEALTATRNDPGALDHWDPKLWHAWVDDVLRRTPEQSETASPNQTTAHGEMRPGTPADEGRSTTVASTGAPKAEKETAPERRERIAAAVHELWPENVAAAVTEQDGRGGREGAFGAFVERVHQLEQRGYPAQDILSRISTDRLVGIDYYGQPVKNPAAFATWHVEQLAKRLPDRTDAHAGLPKLEQYVSGQATGPTPGTDPARLQRAENSERAADEDRAEARGERGQQQQWLDRADDPTAASPDRDAAASDSQQHGEQATELEIAAAGHDAEANYHTGMYESGADAAKLAGEGYPRSVQESLREAQSRGQRSGKAAQARIFRQHGQERSR